MVADNVEVNFGDNSDEVDFKEVSQEKALEILKVGFDVCSAFPL